jgi:hypothetical protein
VPAAERASRLDNDGTPWSEQLAIFACLAFDRIAAMAPQHPEWRSREPGGGVDRDTAALAAAGEKDCSKSWPPRMRA